MSTKLPFRPTSLALVTLFLLTACSKISDNTENQIGDATQTEKHSVMEAKPTTLDLGDLRMTVHKSPTCGCCQSWVDYMKSEGFEIDVVESSNIDSVKAEHGISSSELMSCHTALIDGYVIEGHVPANDVKRLLETRPNIVGLTAPGMPMMSPGMASLTPKDYDVLAFDKDGNTQIWSAY